MRLLLGLLCCARAFYVPGVAPIDFSKEEKVEIKGQGVHSAFLAIFFLQNLKHQKSQFLTENEIWSLLAIPVEIADQTYLCQKFGLSFDQPK